MTSEQLANQVRRFRRMADLTQAQLATAIDVSRQTVVSIEGGSYSPSVHLALRLAGVLGTTVEALFGAEPTSQSQPSQSQPSQSHPATTTSGKQ